MATIDRAFGREAFGNDPATYDRARPAYPDAVWETLRDQAGLRAGIDILEIGAGTGLATRPLLAHEPRRLMAVEADERLADYLRRTIADARLEVIAMPFEALELPAASLDLVACATAFHWLDPVPALRRIRDMLRPGGHVALFWNGYGEPGRADAFHTATVHLFAGNQHSPAGHAGVTDIPFGLDVTARRADFAAAGLAADEPVIRRFDWTLDAAEVRALYSTFSNVTVLEPQAQQRLLDGLEEIATREFGGKVTRLLTTVIYTARR